MSDQDEQYSDEKAERRMNEALRRALSTPPAPQATVRRSRQKPSGQPAESRSSGRKTAPKSRDA